MREESFKAAELRSADSRRRLSPHLPLPSGTIMFGLTLGTIDIAPAFSGLECPLHIGKSQTGQKTNFRPSWIWRGETALGFRKLWVCW
jgi:hypothetical protein